MQLDVCLLPASNAEAFRSPSHNKFKQPVAHLLLPRRPSVGTWIWQPASGTVTMGTNLLLLVAGLGARNSSPPLASANHFVAMAFSPSVSGGQLARACSSTGYVLRAMETYIHVTHHLCMSWCNETGYETHNG